MPDFSRPEHLQDTPPEDMELREGVFCDISGTLVNYENGSSDVSVNEDVAEFLRFARDMQDMPISLCSRVEDNALAPYAMKEEFGYVFGKAIFRSSMLEILIDNNPDEYLHAQTSITPEALKGFAQMNFDQRHELFARLTSHKDEGWHMDASTENDGFHM